MKDNENPRKINFPDFKLTQDGDRMTARLMRFLVRALTKFYNYLDPSINLLPCITTTFLCIFLNSSFLQWLFIFLFLLKISNKIQESISVI